MGKSSAAGDWPVLPTSDGIRLTRLEMYGVSEDQGTSTSMVPNAERVWGAMVKVSVLGTLLAAYFPPVVMVTTGLETFKLVLVGLSMEMSVARDSPVKVTLVIRGFRVRTTEYTLNRFKPNALNPRYNSVLVIPMANRFFIGLWYFGFGNA